MPLEVLVDISVSYQWVVFVEVVVVVVGVVGIVCFVEVAVVDRIAGDQIHPGLNMAFVVVLAVQKFVVDRSVVDLQHWGMFGDRMLQPFLGLLVGNSWGIHLSVEALRAVVQ